MRSPAEPRFRPARTCKRVGWKWHPNQGERNTFKGRVLVLTTFAGETEPWLTHEQWPVTFSVGKLTADLRSQRERFRNVCSRADGESAFNAGLPGYPLAVENAYRVASKIAPSLVPPGR